MKGIANNVKSLSVQVGDTNTLTKPKSVNHIKKINALRDFTVPDPIVSNAFTKENVIVKRDDGKGEIKLNASKQLSHIFNSYAQAINKSYQRTGPLFESSFERKLVDNDNYFTSMIYYCHYNAQLHQMVEGSFKNWPFSSYHSIVGNDKNIVAVDKVLDWFGSKDVFIKQHEERYENKRYINFEIE